MAMRRTENKFGEMVCELVAQIPKGRVMTYGQIAALCGKPRAARIVGGIAHYGDQHLPWQRVVKKDGSLAEGFPGGTEGHRRILEKEGVKISNFKVKDMERRIWSPKEV